VSGNGAPASGVPVEWRRSPARSGQDRCFHQSGKKLRPGTAAFSRRLPDRMLVPAFCVRAHAADFQPTWEPRRRMCRKCYPTSKHRCASRRITALARGPCARANAQMPLRSCAGQRKGGAVGGCLDLSQFSELERKSQRPRRWPGLGLRAAAGLMALRSSRLRGQKRSSRLVRWYPAPRPA